MESFDRLKKALNFQEADRVPLDIGGTTVTSFAKLAYERAMQHRRLSADYDQRLIDPIQQIVTPSEENTKCLGIDTCRVGARRIMNFEERLETTDSHYSIVDDYQCLWQMKREGDLYYNQKSYPLYDAETLSEALNDFSIYDMAAFQGTLRSDVLGQLQQAGDRGIVLDRNCAGLTEVSLRLRGYDKWFMDTVMDPAGVERLLDMLLEHKKQYWQLLIDIVKQAGFEDRVLAMSEADDLGTQTSLLLDPDTLKSVVIPRLASLFQFLKKQLPDAKVFFHTDGAVRSILPDLIEAGVEILNPVQYSAADMDLNVLKKEWGRDLIFWGGGIDTQEVLNKGNTHQVRDEVKRNIETLAPGGGFVFATIHNIQADVPPENFWAMWETLMEFGQY
jgi:uroporphyrinogen decarboxylase